MRDYVTNVIDGDTFVVLGRVTIRLESVYAPEMGAPEGAIAKKKLQELILHEYVEYEAKTRDNYGRIVAQIWVDNINVNETMKKN